MLYGTLFGIKDAKKLLISHKKLTTAVNLTYVKLTAFSLLALKGQKRKSIFHSWKIKKLSASLGLQPVRLWGYGIRRILRP